MSKIGKNVLENLTQAMYSDSRIIYREYIQNSTDQIDIARWIYNLSATAPRQPN